VLFYSSFLPAIYLPWAVLSITCKWKYCFQNNVIDNIGSHPCNVIDNIGSHPCNVIDNIGSHPCNVIDNIGSHPVQWYQNPSRAVVSESIQSSGIGIHPCSVIDNIRFHPCSIIDNIGFHPCNVIGNIGFHPCNVIGNIGFRCSFRDCFGQLVLSPSHYYVSHHEPQHDKNDNGNQSNDWSVSQCEQLMRN
jgi:hypothetical protein